MLSAVTVNEKYLAKLVSLCDRLKTKQIKETVASQGNMKLVNQIRLKDDDLPHFVFFYTTWSKYCAKYAPAWEDLADKYNSLVEKPVCIKSKHYLLI